MGILMTASSSTTDFESLEDFEVRATAWIEAHLPPLHGPRANERELQNLLFDCGYAGIAFPREYGGAGLTLQHQKVFFDSVARLGRQIPQTYSVSIGMLAPTILDHGSHVAKRRFLPPLLRGDELWIQLLSEPRGGSDMAAATCRLTRDGESYVLNGEKTWSSRAYEADFGLCLCRSDWDVPKHRGLSMIAVPLKGTPGVTVKRIRSANGMLAEFCQEFFDDVELPAHNLIGEDGSGWVVAQRLLFHERNASANIGYGYLGDIPRGAALAMETGPLAPNAMAAESRRRRRGRASADIVADSYIDSTVVPLTSQRLMTGMRAGTHKGQWGSVAKLQRSEAFHKSLRATLAVLGADAVIWDGDEVRVDNPGSDWLGSRGGTIAGGSSEMQRNIISERLLGLPREPSTDRDRPFREVLRDHPE